jgi:hypothetical protein
MWLIKLWLAALASSGSALRVITRTNNLRKRVAAQRGVQQPRAIEHKARIVGVDNQGVV